MNADTTSPTNACLEAMLWDKLGNRLDLDAARWHHYQFDMDVDSYEFDPDARPPLLCSTPRFRQRNGEFAKHWLSAQLLTLAINPRGTTRHPPGSFVRYSQHEANFRAKLEHDFDYTYDNLNARHFPDPFGANQITFYCGLFNTNRSGGEPLYRASDFVHEAWHGYYGSHDGEAQDRYYPISYPAIDLSGGAQISVYQVQYDYFCDVFTSPSNWLPRAVVSRAGDLLEFFQPSAMNRGKFMSGFVALDHACSISGYSVIRPRDARKSPTAAGPRYVDARLSGSWWETCAVDLGGRCSEDGFVAAAFEAEVSTAAPVAQPSPFDQRYAGGGELRVVAGIKATLQPNGQDVLVEYRVDFYEDGLDDTAVGSVLLTGADFSPPAIPIRLRSDGDDGIDTTLDLSLDW